MLLLALTLSSSIVCFSLLVLFDQLILGTPWCIAAPKALVATGLGHLLVLLWLYFLRKE